MHGWENTLSVTKCQMIAENRGKQKLTAEVSQQHLTGKLFENEPFLDHNGYAHLFFAIVEKGSPFFGTDCEKKMWGLCRPENNLILIIIQQSKNRPKRLVSFVCF